jgi:signal transduction histidine kinase
MTRRIACAILVTVWAMLIASGVTAYLTTRAVLLADMDETLFAQASALPELMPAGNATAPASALAPAMGLPASAGGDLYVIQTTTNGRKLRPGADAAQGPGKLAAQDGPQIVAKTFSTLADGRRVRAVTLKALAKPTEPRGAPVPVLVTYRGSAESFDQLLDRLAWTLAGSCLAGGLLAAGIAYAVSYVSLKPLRHTAELVGAIDVRHLDRRIPAESLPPELLPVAARINEMLTRLEQAFAQRRKFLADASHELRTPVAALVTGLEVSLARQRQAEAYRSSLASALAEASQLRSLVERLMEQVRSETFSHDEAWQSVDLSTLLDECASAAATLGRGRGIEVRRDFPVGMVFSTQPGRLKSVITNILSNAVEYNKPNGTVDVTASVSSLGLELDVSDTGFGIEPDKLPNVFEPFFRGDDSHRSDAGHLGLGLFLVKSHLEAMNGRCTVESQPGVGSTFHIRVPPGIRAHSTGSTSSPQASSGQAKPAARPVAVKARVRLAGARQ